MLSSIHKSALDSLTDSVYIRDLEGVVYYVNDSFLLYFGMKSEEIVGQKLAEIDWQFEDFLLFDNEDQKVIKDEMVLENFYDFRSKDTFRINQTKTSKTPLFNNEGLLVGISGSITDIGEEYMKSNLLARGVKHYQNIQQLTLSISRLNSEQAILWELAEECALLLGLEDCVIYVYDEKAEVLQQKAAFGGKKKDGAILSPITLQIGEGIVGTAALTKQTILVDDIPKDWRYVADDLNAASEISVPIIFQNQVLGVIDCESQEYYFFNIKHRDFLETIAGIAALKITELRTLKIAREKEQYLNQILESPKDLLSYSIDKNLRYKSFNQNHAKMMKDHFNVDIKLGMEVLSIIEDEEEREGYASVFERALSGEDFAIFENYGHRQKDTYQFLEKYYSPLYSIKGEIIGVTAIIRDITEEKLANLKLRDKERLIESINENIKDGIFRYSLNHGFIYTNKALLELFGLEQLDNDFNDFSLIHVSKNQHLKIINQILKNGLIENKEVHYRRFDDSTFWGLLDCQLTEIDNDQVIDGVIADISPLKNLSQNLLKANSEMDQLVYRTSHDLRAPIASLLGLERLLEHRITDPEQRELLSIMQGQLNRLDGIIMDIITYRKVAKLGLKKEEIDIESLINKVLESMQFMEHYEGIKKELNFNSTSIFIQDAHNLQVIFNNLLSNAIKYSKTDIRDAFVKITVDVSEKYASIKIEDNGIGIDDDYLSNVFNMFYRATNHATGTGLGLFIVKEALQKINGEIEVKSKRGEGSLFTVEIPNLIVDDSPLG